MAKKDGTPKLLALAAQLLLSLLILAALFYFADASAVFAAIASGKLEFFAYASLAYLCVNLFMAYRMHYLLRLLGAPVAYLDTLRCHYLGMLASDFTPARSGYFAAAFALQKRGVNVSKAVASLLAPQMFDFAIKVIGAAAIIALAASVLSLSGSTLLPIAAAFAAIIGFIVIIFALLFHPSLAAPFLPILQRIPLGNKLFVIVTKLQENSPVVRKSLPTILFISATCWALKGFEWWMLSEAIGMHANVPFHPFVFFLLLQPAITLLQFLPTPTPAGAGISEAGAVGILALFGVPLAQAAAFGLLTRAVMLAQDWLGAFEWKNLSLDFLDEQKW